MRRHFGFLIMTALLAGTAACSTAGAATTLRAAAPAAPAAPEPEQVDVLSASFISTSTGWLLAEPGCARQPNPCKATVLMRKTENGGRTWFTVPAPPAPPADAYQSAPPPKSVGRILFTSRSDGWAVGVSLWRTTNGGATWRRVPVPGPLSEFAVAGSHLLAAVLRCPKDGQCALKAYATTTGQDVWRPVPGATLSQFDPSAFAVAGSTGYLLANREGTTRAVLLAGPVTGAARWKPLPVPCRAGWTGALAAAGGWLFLGCANEPGAGNQLKSAYVSRDGGRTWHQVASPPDGGYLQSASMTAGGTVFLSGQRMNVYISRDRGRSWHQSPSLAAANGQANAGFSLTGTAVTNTFGVAVQAGLFSQQVWLTRNADRTWTPVTVH